MFIVIMYMYDVNGDEALLLQTSTCKYDTSGVANSRPFDQAGNARSLFSNLQRMTILTILDKLEITINLRYLPYNPIYKI